MAMYYQGGSEIQADGLQTLYLMNPNCIGYADTYHHQQQQQQSANMFFLNFAAAGNFPHVSLPSQAQVAQGHLVGMPVSAGFQDPNRPSIQEISASHHGLLSRLWSSSDQNSPGGGDGSGGGGGGNKSQLHIPSSTVVSPKSSTGGDTTTDFASQLGFQRPGLVSPTQAHHQGLSLSLSPQQQQQQQMNFRSCLPLDHHKISTTNHQVGILSSSPLPSPKTHTNNIDHTQGVGTSSTFSISNGVILGSKYLKVAQELLDEVVNVGKDIKLSEGGAKEKHKLENELISLASDDVESCNQKNSVVELTTAQRQELQMKKAKLVSMLDEVDQRYRQYHHQMQMIASSFEQTAGNGSSQSYTQLALHTISKQFRCLKDAISRQIKDTSKTLGEEENIGGKIEGSKLKFVDHHLRQQRVLQQLGMMQTNAWRPQRGLPERAVSVLRAWLFEHFLHPYPKDSDKIMLAKQTGLTRSQVSNWFINARVRLWKPMVEEMYMEEVNNKNNQEQNGLDQENIVPNNEVVGSKSSVPQEKLPISSNIIQDASPKEVSTSTISTSPMGGSGGGGGSLPAQATAGFSFISSLNMENIADQRNNKKPKSDLQNSSSTSTFLSADAEINKAGQDHTIKSEKFNGNNNTQTRECYPLMTPYTMDDQFGTSFNPNHQQLTTFHQGNGHVSLTLGLPPNSDQNQHNFLPNNQTIGLGSHYNRINNPQPSHHPNIISYENIDFQSGKRYAAHLLQDFVS